MISRGQRRHVLPLRPRTSDRRHAAPTPRPGPQPLRRPARHDLPHDRSSRQEPIRAEAQALKSSAGPAAPWAPPNAEPTLPSDELSGEGTRRRRTMPQSAPRCSAAFRCGGGLGPAEIGGPNPSGSVASSTARARQPGARPSAQRSGATVRSSLTFLSRLFGLCSESILHTPSFEIGSIRLRLVWAKTVWRASSPRRSR